MKKILLVKTSSMGDLIHCFPALTDLQAHFGDEPFELTWVVEESFQDIPLLHPATTKIIPVAMRRWRKALLSPKTWREYGAFKKAMRAEKWDYVIDAQGLLKSVFLAKKAKQPIHGFNEKSIREKAAARFNTYQYEVKWLNGAIARARLLFSQIFGYTLAPHIDFGLPKLENSNPLTPDEPFVSLIHGTSAESKEWPEKEWIALGKWLRKKGLVSVLFWGNEREKERAERMSREIPKSVVVPRQSLTESAHIIAQSKLVVAVDTGFAHIANSQELPLVMLFTDSKPSHAGAVLTKHNRHVINMGGIGRVPMLDDVKNAIDAFDILPK